jgi:hypothetical protein
VNQSNVQQLSGLDPTTYINNASQAIGQAPGFLFWGPYGALSFLVNPAGQYPVTIDPSFRTPYTNSFNLGIQRQLSADWEVSVDYYHKNIDNILGIRQTDLPFEARINNDFAGAFVNGFGPWYSGKYDAGILSFQKRRLFHPGFHASRRLLSHRQLPGNSSCRNRPRQSLYAGRHVPGRNQRHSRFLCL